jgi:Domain of unknown function (DUF4260)
MSAVLWQRVEGALVFLAMLVAVVGMNLGQGWAWWALALLFFAPDVGFLGYLAGPRVGAVVYNLLHLYGLWLGVATWGFAISGNTAFGLFGLLWAAHVGFDRMLGYGLKESSGFVDTHLGRIGR